MKSILKKALMALSGLFLLVFLLQHFLINFLSVINPDMFNEVSHFMGTNPMVQFALQPVLMVGVVFHFIWGFYLEIENRNARPVKYVAGDSDKAPWVSKNMIISGTVILLFMGLHFVDFFFPEVNTKFIKGDWSGLNTEGQLRYYEHLVHEFENPVRVLLYVLSFGFLGLHVNHGFQSAFQTVGANHPKYTPVIQKVGFFYSVIVPVGFAFIALFHFVNSLN